MVFRLGAANQNWVGAWYGADGELAGYLVYSLERAAEWHVEVREVVALRPEVYRDILAFLATHNLHDRIDLFTGRDVPWRSLVANPHLIKAEAHDSQNFMVRIVDLPRAIALRPAPRSSEPAELTLQVDDEHAPWNQGIWRIVNEGGAWQATRAEIATPDAKTDISALSSLFAGFLSVTDAVDTGLLRTSEVARPVLDSLLRTTYPPTSRDHF